LDGLITTEVEDARDEELWDEAVAEEERGKHLLSQAARRWTEVFAMLEGEAS
jgi:hypothetical protein